MTRPRRTGSGRAAAAAGAAALALALVGGGAGLLHAQVVPDSLDGARYGRLEGDDITVRFAPPDSLVAERVLEFLRTQLPLPGLPPELPRDVTVALAHTPEALDLLTGGVVPEWRAGVAIPSLRLLVVPTGEGTRVLSPEGRRVLRHEWAHLGLHGHMGDLRIPRWFDEGYAQWASGGFDATEAWRLRVQVALGRTPPLDSLSLAWPRSRTDAEGAYLLAASALTFLLRESGPRGLALFLERWREDRSFEEAFRRTFGVTGSQFEEDWKRHVRERYGWLFVLSHSAVFWLGLTLALLVMVRIRARYDRERMARLRAGEEPERPAYWRGEGAWPPEGDAGSSPAADPERSDGAPAWPPPGRTWTSGGAPVAGAPGSHRPDPGGTGDATPDRPDGPDGPDGSGGGGPPPSDERP